MKIIIGLGNPGEKYQSTRHNVGFLTLNQLAKDIEAGPWQTSKKMEADLATKNYSGEKIILAKPQTFMNRSGESVKKMSQYYKTNPEEMVVIHDDIDIPLGEIRIQQNRSAAGHKGVQSIIDQIQSQNFIRLRLGIKPQEKPEQTEKFVVQKFLPEEKELIKKTIEKASRLIQEAINREFI